MLLVLVVKRYYNIDFFGSYDYNLTEELILPGDINENVSIGIGTSPTNDAFLNVNGDLAVKNKFCIGNVCLTYDILKKLNKLPLFTTDHYCLYDSNGNKECIDEEHLKMLTGEKNIIFTDRNNNSFEAYEVAHHGRSKSETFNTGHDGSADGSPYSGFEIAEPPYQNCPSGRGNADCQGYYGCMPGNAAGNAVCAHPSNGKFDDDGGYSAYDPGHTSLYCSGGKFWHCPDKAVGQNLYYDKGKTHLETLKKQTMDKNKDEQQFRLLTFPEEGEVTINYKCYE
tara:strand:- start:279 stop:1124 length:846 start_codon:yes stop_codon:yes gene_type:complete